jgi:hypothetical protein
METTISGAAQNKKIIDIPFQIQLVQYKAVIAVPSELSGRSRKVAPSGAK